MTSVFMNVIQSYTLGCSKELSESENTLRIIGSNKSKSCHQKEKPNIDIDRKTTKINGVNVGEYEKNL